MAIRDLLWACPRCEAVRALRAAKDGDACTACGTVFRRGAGSAIVADPQDGEAVVRPAAEWVERLPDPASLAALPADERWDEHVEARFACSETPVRDGHEYLGRVERFGPARTGMLRLRPRRLTFDDDDGAERAWPLERITAVQASSRTLQLKMRGDPVVSFRFPSGSLRFWEVRLQQTLRRLHRERYQVEILEFQPRIVTR